jgi:hypothetical protein
MHIFYVVYKIISIFVKFKYSRSSDASSIHNKVRYTKAKNTFLDMATWLWRLCFSIQNNFVTKLKVIVIILSYTTGKFYPANLTNIAGMNHRPVSSLPEDRPIITIPIWPKNESIKSLSNDTSVTMGEYMACNCIKSQRYLMRK